MKDTQQIIRQSMDMFAHRTMRDWARFVKESGMSMPQFNIMMHLHYHHLSNISEISEWMDISAAAASQLVEKLFNNGLIERTEDPDDRRTKQITLTAKGEELIKIGVDQRYRWVELAVAGMSVEERRKIREALQMLSRVFIRLDEKEMPTTEDTSE